MTEGLIADAVGVDKDNSGPKRDWLAWFETPEGIVTSRLEMLHLLRTVLRDHGAELGVEWDELERASATSGLSIACSGLREELLVWADREFAAAEQELAQLKQA